MGLPNFTTNAIPTSDVKLNSGLNTSSNPLALQDSEASDLQNIDFNVFGSFKQRSGYTALNTSELNSGATITGLHWYEPSSGTDLLMATSGTKLYKMDDLDGTWDDISGTASVTADTLCDFTTFRDTVIGTTNGAPFTTTGGAAAPATVPTGLTRAKFVENFQNYAFYANVTVSGTARNSRIYWSKYKDITSWSATRFIDVEENNGQDITGIQKLNRFMYIFKDRSIYQVEFTGLNEIPFFVTKTASSVGAVSGFSIQEVENGLVFLSQDGLYYFDGNQSFKISDRIDSVFRGLTENRKNVATSVFYKKRNLYMLSVSDDGASSNDLVIVWDSVNNAFSKYTGIAAASLAIVWVDGIEERPYFGDYDGFAYRMDTGTSDNPLNSETAISSFYKTNWKTFGDIVNKKGTVSVTLFYEIADTTMTFAYSYDLEESDQYSQSLDLSGSGAKWDQVNWDEFLWAGSGGSVQRRDIDSRGRAVRFIFRNDALNQTFQFNGIGTFTYLETNV